MRIKLEIRFLNKESENVNESHHECAHVIFFIYFFFLYASNLLVYFSTKTEEKTPFISLDFQLRVDSFHFVVLV